MANLGKVLAQIVVAGGQIIGRAFTRALREELRNSQQAAAARGGSRAERSKAASDSLQFRMTLQEARQILDVPDLEKPQQILDNYNHLFAVNDKDKGGSFYLQSKIYRAKERIDAELRNSGIDLETFYGTRSGSGSDTIGSGSSASTSDASSEQDNNRGTTYGDSYDSRRQRRNPPPPPS